jgi:predicted Rossmann fold nucleotide-binding protein DprA/Smf involved in DNA uptake
LRRGALAVRHVDEALTLLSLGDSASGTGSSKAIEASTNDMVDVAAEPTDGYFPLSGCAAQLFGALQNIPLDLGELCARTGFAAAECAAALIELELSGQCSRLPGGRYIGHSPLS